MLDTTQTFYDNSIYKFRTVTSNVTVDMFDNTFKTNVSSVTVNGNRYFYSTQIYNNTLYSDKYATGELNEFKLDGSMTLLPNTITTEEIGWWSIMSNSSGQYTTNPQITIETTNTHDSIGITCYYDEFSYPLKSKCYWYNGSTLLDSLELDGDGSIQVFDNPVDGFDKIVIEIIKAKPYAYVKLAEVTYGITRTFDGRKLQSINTKEYTSIMSNTIEPNQLEFKVIDYEGVYDLFNPTQLVKYFKAGQLCDVKAGVLNKDTDNYEYISMGKYYVDTAYTQDGVLTVNAFGVLNILNAQTFYSPWYSNATVEDIVDDIMGDYSYYINPNVKSIQLTGYIPLTSKKEALKYVAIASGAVIKEGRDGVVYIYQATPDFSTNQIIAEDTIYSRESNAGMLIAGENNLLPIVEPVPYIFTVLRSQRLSDIKISMIGLYNRCDVVYKSYTLGSSETLYDETITTDESGYAIIKYNGPVSISNVTTTADYENFADCTVISGTASTTYQVTVVGQKRESIDNVASSFILSDDAYEEAKQTMTLDNCNELISNASRAKSLASWYLTSLQKRKDIEFDWWSVATCEASDFINVMTSFDDKEQMQINEIDYNLSDLVARVKGIM